MKQTLTQALELQQDVLAGQTRSADAREKQKKIAASICYSLAEQFMAKGRTEDAQRYAQQALKFNEADHKSRLYLAKIYLMTDQLELAQNQVCVSACMWRSTSRVCGLSCAHTTTCRSCREMLVKVYAIQ